MTEVQNPRPRLVKVPRRADHYLRKFGKSFAVPMRPDHDSFFGFLIPSWNFLCC